MAARGIKSSSPALDMKAPIALDGVHKAQAEQEFLSWGNILWWSCYTGSVHPWPARRSPGFILHTPSPATNPLFKEGQGRIRRQRKDF